MRHEEDELKAPLIGISRHRLATDGAGVTTLVTFHGCPLHCRYCLNPRCLSPQGVWRMFTPVNLLNAVFPDDLYFQATGGGITFGGGEPLLRSRFIRVFCEMAPDDWRITIETSLNADLVQLQEVAPFVSEYYVDVKDMNPDIYRRYALRDNQRVLSCLRWLAGEGLQDKVVVRLPLIPDFNTDADRGQSRQQLQALGFTRFGLFTYIRDVEAHKLQQLQDDLQV